MKSIHDLSRGSHTPGQRLHDRIAVQLRRFLAATYRVGDKIETEPALAHRFSVSIPTIRNAMLVLERDGLVERRHGSGTYVCERRARQHIGIALPAAGLASPTIFSFHLRMARRLWERFEEAGHCVKLYVADDEASTEKPQLAYDELCEACDQGRLSAFVSLTTLTPRLMEPVLKAGVILTGKTDQSAAQVDFDYNGMIRDGISQLIAAGRRRLALIGWGAPDHRHNIRDVFAEAMDGAGLKVRLDWICDSLPAFKPGAGWEAFRDIWFGSREKPDGLLIGDDILYRDAAIAIKELDVRVPQELMVATHFNKGTVMPHLFPVTLLEFDPEAYSDALAQATLDLMEGRRPKRDYMLSHQVVPAVPANNHASAKMVSQSLSVNGGGTL